MKLSAQTAQSNNRFRIEIILIAKGGALSRSADLSDFSAQIRHQRIADCLGFLRPVAFAATSRLSN
ncbi:MAG TPA: hypothetical protein PKO33_12725, partial [Pyrinomonadaceae bacterium]|nr:hypothetical protein [Pyrinomonadaceae bacterium]